MPELIVYGASDDLIEVEGDLLSDEFGNYTSDGHWTGGRLVISIDDIDLLEIVPVYRGYWAFAIGPMRGDYDAMPAFPIEREWGTKCDYSETLTIKLPDRAQVRWIQRKE
jgi:hypothetical protein